MTNARHRIELDAVRNKFFISVMLNYPFNLRKHSSRKRIPLHHIWLGYILFLRTDSLKNILPNSLDKKLWADNTLELSFCQLSKVIHHVLEQVWFTGSTTSTLQLLAGAGSRYTAGTRFRYLFALELQTCNTCR